MTAYHVTLFCNLLIAIAVTAVWSRRPAASIYHPATFYLVFHIFIFVVRPIMSQIYGYEFVYVLYDFQPSVWDKIRVILGANLGLLVFMAVSLRFAGEPMVFVQDSYDHLHRDLMRKPFLIACAVLVPIGLYSASQTWLIAASDASTMVLDATTQVRINTKGTGYFTDLQLMLATISAMFAWIFRFRLWALLPFAGFFLLRAGTGGRGPFIFASALLMLLFLFDRRRRWPEWRSLLLIGIAFLAFRLVVADRGAAIRSLFIEDVTQTYNLGYQVAPLEDMDFANMEYFEYLVHTIPAKTGTYDYGVSLLQIFTEPIPRVWWPGKPAGAPIRFFNIFDYGNPVGMTFSLPGYGWYIFGFFGIVVLTAVFALCYAWFYRRMMDRRQANFAMLFTMCMTAMTVVSYRDGSFVSIAKMSLFYLTPIAVTYAMAKIVGVSSAAEMRHLAAGGMTQSQGARPAPANATSEHETPAQRRRRRAAALVRRSG